MAHSGAERLNFTSAGAFPAHKPPPGRESLRRPGKKPEQRMEWGGGGDRGRQRYQLPLQQPGKEVAARGEVGVGGVGEKGRWEDAGVLTGVD